MALEGIKDLFDGWPTPTQRVGIIHVLSCATDHTQGRAAELDEIPGARLTPTHTCTRKVCGINLGSRSNDTNERKSMWLRQYCPTEAAKFFHRSRADSSS